MDNQIDDDIKDSRRDKIMEIQQEISCNNNKKLIGHEFHVFIEGKLVDDDVYIGRTYMDAPDVDGLFFIKSMNTLNSGDFVKGKVTSFNEYDLIGEIV